MIEKDKLNHLKWGIVIGFFGSIICAIVAGLTAEYKDKAHGGRWDNQDLIMTILGGWFGECLRILLLMLFKEKVFFFIVWLFSYL